MTFSRTFCSPAGQPSREVRCLSLLRGWHVLHICEELQENAWTPRRPQGTQLTLCLTPDSSTSFPWDCIVSFDKGMQNLWVTRSAQRGYLFHSLHSIVNKAGDKGNRHAALTEAPVERKKRQRGATEDTLKHCLSLFQSALGQADDVWGNAGENQTRQHTIKALIKEDTAFFSVSTWSQCGCCRRHI